VSGALVKLPEGGKASTAKLHQVASPTPAASETESDSLPPPRRSRKSTAHRQEQDRSCTASARHR
jgi:hypothetical protein